MDKVFAKVKASGATVVTAGAAPLNPSGNAASKFSEVVIRDPDGFFVELQQPDPLPASRFGGVGACETSTASCGS